MLIRLLFLVGFTAALLPVRAIAQTSEGLDFFERKIRPVLVEHCHRCHGPQKPKAHLRLDSRATMLKGGDSGPAVVPGEPGKSRLVKAISYEDAELRMPPRGKLPDEIIADLTRWIELGAPWPDDTKNQKLAVSKEFDLKARSRHWSLQPLAQPALPAVRKRDWLQSPIDAFILARLEENGLTPSSPAAPHTLLRRLYFDLVGLPPTPEEITAFLRDVEASRKVLSTKYSAPDAANLIPRQAIEKVVERLLASPHYGERWGRHWLDLVRFAETLGHEFDFDIPDAWRYRDYVVRALNDDVPYHHFVMEHIAGDLLPNPRRHAKDKTNESVLGTGFWWLGEAKHSPVDSRADQADRIDNQIDVFGKTFLGMTIACARCHDHKFDAISAKDYYALAGYLQSSRQDRAFLDDAATRQAALEPLRKLHADVRDLAPKQHFPQHVSPDDGLFAHFAKDGWGDWLVAGEAFGRRPSRAGDVLIQPERAAEPVSAVAPGWAHSGLLSLKLHGLLRSPTFAIEKRYIHYRIAGVGTKCNLILNGLQLIREPIYGGLTFGIDNEKPHWRTQDVGMWRSQRAYIEILDEGPGYAALEQVIFSDDARPPTEPRGARETPLSPINQDNRASVLPLVAEFRKQEALLPPWLRGLATADGSGVDEYVFIRGNPKNLGQVTPRRFLEVFGGDQMAAPKYGSGRLELARQLVDPKQTPILPRVLVNRIWKHHFGEGIVRSPDDFGVLGQAPTHPELLDYLASEFVKNDWSIKKLHRMILLSATYQQETRFLGETGFLRDPENRLLGRMNVRRLEAEAIRDALLAVSGRLERTVGGPSVPVHLTPFMLGRGRPTASGPLDGDGRRSLYISVRRNFLTPMFTAFDYPTPFSTMGRRSVSNVPAQALTMLNNPLVLQQAELWAKRVLAEPGQTAAARVERMYLMSVGRPPSPREREAALAFLREQAALYGNPEDVRGWADLAHVLFNLKEFIFVS